MLLVRASIALLVATTALAGCLKPDVEESASFTLNRQIDVNVNAENVKAAQAASENGGSPSPYLFLRSSFVVTVREGGVSAADLLLAYTNEDGAEVVRSLSELSQKSDLEAGDVIRVEGVNLTSRALLTHKGEPVADRARSAVDWWQVGGYPIGYAMAPGSSIAYDVSAGVTEKFSIENLKPKDEDVTLEAGEASLSFNYDGALALDYGTTPEATTATTPHQARPLAWTASGTFSMPALLSIKGSDASTGETIDAGIESLSSTGATFDAKGKLWINESRSPVLAEVESGTWSTKADVIAWLTGTDLEAAANFSCAGKTRADACRPTEFELDQFTSSEAMEPSKEALDTMPYDVDAEMLEQLTAFLLEDLRPGDRVSFHLDLSAEDFPDYVPEDGGPETMRVVLDAEVRAQDFEDVSIAGRTFEALKVVERVGVRVEIGQVSEDGEVVFDGLTIDQKFVDLNLWLAKGSFVPLRIEQTIPFDVGAVVGDVLDGLGPEAWAEAPIEPLAGDDLSFTTETRTSLELTKLEGDVQHSPWLLLGGFNAMWSGIPMMGLGMPFGGSPAEPDWTTQMPYCPPQEPDAPPMPCEDPYGYPGADGEYGWDGSDAHSEMMCYAPSDSGEMVETPCEDYYYGDPYAGGYENWTWESDPSWNESSTGP